MITIVRFMAYGQPHTRPFMLGENFEQIHAALYRICNTYEPLEIITCSAGENVALHNLNNIKNAKMREDVLQLHAENVAKKVFITVLRLVAPNVVVAYRIAAETLSEYMINQAIERGSKLPPAEAHRLFPGIQEKGFVYEVA